MSRILAISDIHGCYDKFIQLLNSINYNPSSDQLIIMGDLMDRGQSNLKCLFKAMELQNQGAIILKGNHEQMAEETINYLLDCKDNKANLNYPSLELHRINGGTNTIRELTELSTCKLIDIYDFIQSLPTIHTIDQYIFVHAGVNASISLNNNYDDDFMWSRDEFINYPAYKNQLVIFGHTPTWYMNLKSGRVDTNIMPTIWFDPEYKDKIGIDCGCVFGGRLSCLELPTMKEYYV
jgi:serine/threonine protein phosphatase 1